MKVLMVNTLYHPNIVGGAERSVQLLAESLARNGHEVSVATLSPEKVNFGKRVVNGVDVYYLPLQNIFFPFENRRRTSMVKALWHLLDAYNSRMFREVAQILNKIRPDIVHTHNLSGFSVAVWKAVREHNIPLVHTLRDYYLLCTRSTMFRDSTNCERMCAECRLFSTTKRTLAKHVNVVTGVSQFILERHLRYGYFKNAKRAVVYNAYDPPKRDSKTNIEHKLSERKLRFGYMGRLSPTKGIEELLRAFSTLPSKNAELLIAGRGDPDYETRLRKVLVGRGNVHWLGFVAPEELFAAIDVLVVPSLWHDPAPRVVLEAMGNGIPVVGSRRGGIPELLGNAGWTFDPDRLDDLESRLRQCLSSPNEVRAMSQRARERARQFSSENMLAGYLRIYESLLKEYAS